MAAECLRAPQFVQVLMGAGERRRMSPRRVISQVMQKQLEVLMKLLVEILLAIVLHPLAVILVWINLARRSDLTTTKRIVWALVALVWGIGPILYVLVGDGEFW
jgi:hypothetical protein